MLSSCSTLQKRPTTSPAEQHEAWLAHKSALNKLTHWQLSGRFGAQSDTESWHGSLQWSQKNDQFNIHLSGPLGSGSVILGGNAEYSTLTLGKDKVFSARDPEFLLTQHTGLHFPIKSLRYWVVGLPSPLGAAEAQHKESGLLSRISQNEWDVSYKNYHQIKNVQLPGKIFLKNEAYNVRLIIKKWQILPE